MVQIHLEKEFNQWISRFQSRVFCLCYVCGIQLVLFLFKFVLLHLAPIKPEHFPSEHLIIIISFFFSFTFPDRRTYNYVDDLDTIR